MNAQTFPTGPQARRRMKLANQSLGNGGVVTFRFDANDADGRALSNRLGMALKPRFLSRFSLLGHCNLLIPFNQSIRLRAITHWLGKFTP